MHKQMYIFSEHWFETDRSSRKIYLHLDFFRMYKFIGMNRAFILSWKTAQASSVNFYGIQKAYRIILCSVSALSMLIQAGTTI